MEHEWESSASKTGTARFEGSGLEIETYWGREGFAKIQSEWRYITENMTKRGFHHLYEWYESYVDSVDDHSDLYLLTVRRNKKPVAVCPLRLITAWICGVRLRVLEQPYLDVHCDFVYEKCSANRPVLAAVAEFLQSQLGIPHDVLWIEGLRSDSAVLFSAASCLPAYSITLFQGLSGHIPTEAPYGEILNLTPRKHRENLRAAERRLARLRNVRIMTDTTTQALPQAMEQFLDVEASGWKGEEGPGTAVKLDDEVHRRFDAAMHHFGAQGKCRIDRLTADGQCIAAQFSLLVDDTLAVMKTGYNEDYKHVSPGHVLLARTIKQCCESEHVSQIDLISAAHWTRVWKPRRTGVYELFVFNRTPLASVAWPLLLLRTAMLNTFRKLKGSSLPAWSRCSSEP